MTQPKEEHRTLLSIISLIKLQSAWIKFEMFSTQQHIFMICTFVFFATVFSHGGDKDDDDDDRDNSGGRNQAWDQND